MGTGTRATCNRMSRLRRLLPRAEHDLQGPLLVAAQDLDDDRVARLVRGERAREAAHVLDEDGTDRGDDVALLEAGLLSGAAVEHAPDRDAARVGARRRRDAERGAAALLLRGLRVRHPRVAVRDLADDVASERGDLRAALGVDAVDRVGGRVVVLVDPGEEEEDGDLLQEEGRAVRGRRPLRVPREREAVGRVRLLDERLEAFAGADAADAQRALAVV